MGSVRFHGSWTDRQQVGNLLVAVALRYELKNLALALRQRIVPIDDSLVRQVADVVVEHDGSNRWTEKRLARGHRSNRANQVRVGGVFQEVAARAGLQRL